MTSETPCNETKARWLAEANGSGAALVEEELFEGRPVADEGKYVNPYYGTSRGYGFVIVRFADGTTGVRAFPIDDPTGPGWACDAPPRAGGLSHGDLLEAIPRFRTKARAVKLRWCAGAGGSRALALFVGKYRGRKHETAAKRRTFKKIDERFVMEPIDEVRTMGLRLFALRREAIRQAVRVKQLRGDALGPMAVEIAQLAAMLERLAPKP
jgi:hypothetical protein